MGRSNSNPRHFGCCCYYCMHYTIQKQRCSLHKLKLAALNMQKVTEPVAWNSKLESRRGELLKLLLQPLVLLLLLLLLLPLLLIRALPLDNSYKALLFLTRLKHIALYTQITMKIVIHNSKPETCIGLLQPPPLLLVLPRLKTTITTITTTTAAAATTATSTTTI